MGKVIVAVILIMALAQQVSAQDTATPTPTHTPTSTVTPLQSLSVLWTLEPEATDEPGQAVMMSYTVSIDEAITALLLFAILTAVWVAFVIVRLKGWL